MADRFFDLRAALADADRLNRPNTVVSTAELGRLLTDYDRLVDAIHAAGFRSVAELRGGVPELNRLASSDSGRRPTGQMLTQVLRESPHHDEPMVPQMPDRPAGQCGGCGRFVFASEGLDFIGALSARCPQCQERQ